MEKPLADDAFLKLEKVSEIVKEAGYLAASLFSDQMGRLVRSKAPGNLVSDADHRVEQLIRERLNSNFPNVPVIGEEFGGDQAMIYWSVDPIDGTSNFLSGLPIWAVSVGLVEDGTPTLGVIFAPMLNVFARGTIFGGYEFEGMSKRSAPQCSKTYAVGKSPRGHLRNGMWWSVRSWTLAARSLILGPALFR